MADRQKHSENRDEPLRRLHLRAPEKLRSAGKSRGIRSIGLVIYAY
jgi:hypothetical protein